VPRHTSTAEAERHSKGVESYPFRCGDTRQRLEERAKEEVGNKDGNKKQSPNAGSRYRPARIPSKRATSCRVGPA